MVGYSAEQKPVNAPFYHLPESEIMHTDARQLENGSVLEGDVCIIGTGAAGISMALQFNNTPHKVILLEGGGFEYEDSTQELMGGQQTGQKYYPLKSTRLHYFGGTTGHWGGFCSFFDPVAFSKRDWVSLSGWPITQQTLMPFYERANKILEIKDFNYNADEWMKNDKELIPLGVDRSVFWHKIWRFSPPTRFGQRYRTDILESKNIHLYTYAHASIIDATENGKEVSQITIKNTAGKTHTVKAKYFIMACCAIQNTRLLLNSNKQAAAGLGNDNGNVGRYFMEHAEVKAAEFWLKEKTPFLIYENYKGNMRAELAMTPETQARYKVLNGIISFNPLYISSKMPTYIQAWQSDDPRKNEKAMADSYAKADEGGGRIKRLFKPWKPEGYSVVIRLEQAPNPDSRVTLIDEKDALGIPKVKLNWILGEQEKYSARKIYEIFGQQIGKAGIGRVKLLFNLLDEKDTSMPENTSAGWHHMGTTRMSDDPKTGVVDAHCKVHGINNLFIASSSCFPTGGGVNPTMTIVALSLRVADHVKQKLGS